jgi:hypothetical protein
MSARFLSYSRPGSSTLSPTRTSLRRCPLVQKVGAKYFPYNTFGIVARGRG